MSLQIPSRSVLSERTAVTEMQNVQMKLYLLCSAARVIPVSLIIQVKLSVFSQNP